MHMWRYIIVSALICLWGCSGRTDYRKASFRDEKDASVEIIGNPLELGVPVDLCQEGDFLFVLAYTSENWLHIYDKKTGVKVSTTLKVGRGPGEAVNLVSMDYLRQKKDLYVYDMVLRRTLVYHLDGESGDASYVREIQHPSAGVLRKCHLLPDGRYLYEGYFPESEKDTRFTLSDGVSAIDVFSDYPGIDNENNRYAFTLGVCKGDPASGRFVAGTMFGAVLECFDVSSSEIRPTGVRLLDPPEMDLSGPAIQPRSDTKYGFSTFCLTDRLIYAVYLDGTDPNDFKTIATFDWAGKEQTKYVTDCNILRMCVSDDGTDLYGITSSPLMEFSLARILFQ